MLIIIFRTVLMYGLVVIAMRIMGKQQIGQLQPFELVITIMISELAAIPLASAGVPLLNGITPILILIFLQVMISYISLKSDRARAIICGTPSILIENGKIVESEMINLRYNLSDLMEQLRAKNVPNISDVEFAILETSGELSVVPKSHKRPVYPEDLHIPTRREGLSYSLIMDGKVMHKNLRKLRLDSEWLQQELLKSGIRDPKEVLFACLDTKGSIYVQTKRR